MAKVSKKYETYESARGAKTVARKGSDLHKKIESTKGRMEKISPGVRSSTAGAAAAKHETDKLKKKAKKK